MIADYIEVVAIECRHGKVRLGFNIPDDIVVLRKEVWEKERTEAAAGPIASTAVTHCNAG